MGLLSPTTRVLPEQTARAATARPADAGQSVENARMENRALAAKLQTIAYRDASSGIPGTRESRIGLSILRERYGS